MTYIICTITCVATRQDGCVSLCFTPPGMVESTSLIILDGFQGQCRAQASQSFLFS